MEEESASQSKTKLPRLYHKKSKTGCQRCRARRVKCDEIRPICRSCQRHKVPCVYANHAPLQNVSSNSSSSLQIQKSESLNTPYPVNTLPFAQNGQDGSLQLSLRASASSTQQDSYDTTTISLPEDKSRRMLELRLLQNFIEETSRTFSACNSPIVQRSWSVVVPKLSFNHENLLYRMFAVSALHLLKSEPKNTELMVARQAYVGLSLHEHRRAVAELNSQTADAVCFTSSLTSIDSFASLQNRSLDPYLPPMDWIQMAQGTGSIFSIALNAIDNFETSPVQDVINSKPDLCNEDEIFSAQNRKGHLQDLMKYEKQSEMWDLESLRAYEKTLNYIGGIQLGIASGEHILETARRVMAFPTMIPKRFIEFIQECRPRALVVLAHFFALTSGMTHIWWIGDMPRREIEATARFLPPQWHAAMELPLSAVRNRSLLDVEA